MLFKRTKTAAVGAIPEGPRPLNTEISPVFDSSKIRTLARDSGTGDALTSGALVHVSSLGLLGLLAIAGAPWWAFALLACAWLMASWAA
ncbi:MAG: hypothetical protein ACI9U2_003292 [Bradymonadia bacterium]|jgi:hypothetical protein